ncbi:fucose-binding protein [Rathayibacter sp. VKM Ac-2803]|uniref:RbsD/FucU family protein n=1 Tax=unclassified Rathayibacter TaxID=2609250 RepID=UPI001359973F|nr:MULTISPECIES: RbsD/FucU domain-containing protein [unclassified Rathayibacter]MWV47860.1 fucose-binding protein [Rathayibacter sp. VKM Ac-2803]MWV58924.1 fucose-binding protein [Rathayibacter sp. VKM Ac-2754]
MLKGIDPLLPGALLHLLDDMGHGDQLLLVDRNFPAVATGRPVVRLGEATMSRAMGAVLSVFPLDVFVPTPLERMEVDGDPSRTTPEQDAVLELARASHPEPLQWGVIPRLEFYARARAAFAVVHVLDPAPWGCFVLQKGVVFPEGS